MNTMSPNRSTDDLPLAIQKELELIKSLVLGTFSTKVAMIWLFGSYARGDAINDRRVDEITGLRSSYHSDLDVLVIVHGRTTAQKTSKWSALRRAISEHKHIKRSVQLICESKKRMNEALKYSEYFYVDIVKEGIILYDPQTLILTRPGQLTLEAKQRFALDYFTKFFNKAKSSKHGLELYYRMDDRASSMYCLHQMAERLYYCYLLVFTHYKPRSHDLVELRELTLNVDDRIMAVFPASPKDEENRYRFLNAAYVDARYKLNYHVDPTVLDSLIERVLAFELWVYQQCIQYIQSMPLKPVAKLDGLPTLTTIDLEYLNTEPDTMIQQQAEQLAQKDRLLDEADIERRQLLQRLRDAGIEP